MPEAERAIGRWRLAHTYDAPLGIPPHVTVLYPFVPPERIVDEDLEHVRAIVSRQRGFAFKLSRTARWPGVLYLAPDPSEPFQDLIAAVRNAYPDLPPYGDPTLEPVPHVTVAETDDDGTLFDAVSADVERALPIEAFARSLWLMESGADRRWRLRAEFPFASG